MSDKQLTTYAPNPASYTFEQIHRMAAAFAKSGLFGVKDPDSALALMLHAQASGKHPATVMKDYDIIQGRLAKKAEAMLRDFQSSGGRVKWTKYADDGVTGIFTHPLAPEPLTVEWDLDRAKRAELASKGGGMYAKFPRAMFRSRCISEGVRTTAPEATEQMYTAEELRDITPPAAAPIPLNDAVKQAAENAKKTPLTKEELDGLIDSMDVKTMPELTTAFGHAYTRAKEAGDENAKVALKGTYDMMKSSIEFGEATGEIV